MCIELTSLHGNHLVLTNTFSILDVFTYSSFTTDEFEQYDKLKKILIEKYKPVSNDGLKLMDEAD